MRTKLGLRRGLLLVGILALSALACNLTGDADVDGVTGTPTTASISSITPLATSSDPSATMIATATALLLPPTVTPDPVLVCNAVINDALERVDDFCVGTGRNEACYGHNHINIALHPGASGNFNVPGNRIALASISRLETSPYNVAGEEWGVALLRVQADLPDTLPGQAVTIIAFGEASIEDAGGAMPMSSVFINTGLGDPACSSGPAPGVLIQNDSEAVASLTINGLNLSIGSTVLVQARPHHNMTLGVIEGQVDAQLASAALIPGDLLVAIAGSQIRVALGGANGLQPISAPQLEPLEVGRIQASVLRPLPETVSVPPPLDAQGLQMTRQPLVVTPLLATQPPLAITSPPVVVTVTPLPTWTSPPTFIPTIMPTLVPTIIPTFIPTIMPTFTAMPTLIPTIMPTPTSYLSGLSLQDRAEQWQNSITSG